MKFRVLIVDAEELRRREIIKSLLGLSLVFVGVRDSLEKVQRYLASLAKADYPIVVAVDSGDELGIDVLQFIHRYFPTVPVAVIQTLGSRVLEEDVLKLGATAVMSIEHTSTELPMFVKSLQSMSV